MKLKRSLKSFKLVPFESLGAVSYSPSTVTMALSCISSEIKPDIGRKYTSKIAKIIWFLLVLHWAVDVIESHILHQRPNGVLEETK